MENKSSRDRAEQTIAEWQLAKLKGITQAAFAESMGLSPRTLRQIGKTIGQTAEAKNACKP